MATKYWTTKIKHQVAALAYCLQSIILKFMIKEGCLAFASMQILFHITCCAYCDDLKCFLSSLYALAGLKKLLDKINNCTIGMIKHIYWTLLPFLLSFGLILLPHTKYTCCFAGLELNHCTVYPFYYVDSG